MNLVKHEGHILELGATGYFSGWLPVLIPEAKPELAPMINWDGQLMPLIWWRAILAFFQWTQDTYGCESQVRLFYAPDARTETHGHWLAVPFPQTTRGGLSTSELEHVPEYAQIKEEVLRAGFLPIGSIHHHCNCGAFQSGTDMNDEQKQFGIHITVGNLSSPTYSSHVRVSFRNVMYQGIALENVIDTRNPGEDLLEDPHRRQQVLLGRVTEQETFPEVWKTRLIKAEPVRAPVRQEMEPWWKQQQDDRDLPRQRYENRQDWRDEERGEPRSIRSQRQTWAEERKLTIAKEMAEVVRDNPHHHLAEMGANIEAIFTAIAWDMGYTPSYTEAVEWFVREYLLQTFETADTER